MRTLSFLQVVLFSYSIYGNNNPNSISFSMFRAQECRSYTHDSIPHPVWESHSVHLFRPEGVTGKIPTVFFFHGIRAEAPVDYMALITHITSRGYAVVFFPYPASCSYLFPGKTLDILWRGIIAGAETWRNIIDFDNVGFVGHSYGAGAVPSLAYRALTARKWGARSAFIYVMAPWYVHGISQRQLKTFPPHAKVVVEVFADDRINDHRIGKDLFLSIGVPDTSKVFCILRADGAKDGRGNAVHDVPMGESTQSLQVGTLDYCGVYLVFDALCAYIANASAGEGRFRHEDVTYRITGPSGGTCVLECMRKPAMVRTQLVCANFWRHSMNPRRKFYRTICKPVRLLLTTPGTVMRYGNMALFAIGERVFM